MEKDGMVMDIIIKVKKNLKKNTEKEKNMILMVN